MRWLANLFLLMLSFPVWLADTFATSGKHLRARIRFRLDFRPRPDDIFIATYPKSGTTWMQMVLVQLLGGERAEFDHITQQSPYLENVVHSGRIDYLEKLPSPRIFKTHLTYEQLKPRKDARIIFITRDARDTFVSCYHHLELARRFRSPFDRFMGDMVRGRSHFGSWYEYMRSWMPHRSDPNVLWVRYEDMRQDLEGQVRRVAAFLGIPVPEERMADLLEKCGFAYMKQHDSKFDFRTSMYGASPGGFIRQGGSRGKSQPIREEHAAELEKNVARLRGELRLRETENF
jgi:hypothetical protein